MDFPARILELVAISFPRGSSWPRDQTPHLQEDSLPLSYLGSPNNRLSWAQILWFKRYTGPCHIGLVWQDCSCFIFPLGYENESDSLSVTSDFSLGHGCSFPGSSGHVISQQAYWSGLSFPSSGGLPDPGIKSRSPVLQADSLPAEPQGKPKIRVVGVISLNRLPRKSHPELELQLCLIILRFVASMLLH